MIEEFSLTEEIFEKEKIDLDIFPSTALCRTLKEIVDEETWARARKLAYVKDSYRCRHCGGKGEGFPVYAIPIWSFTDVKVGKGYFIQKLERVISVCPKCFSLRRGWPSFEAVLPLVAEMWDMKLEETFQVVEEKMENMERLSRRLWVLDLSAIESTLPVFELRDPRMRIMRNGQIEGEV